MIINDSQPQSLTSTDVHSFYQDVFITDMNKQISKCAEEASDFKLKMIQNSNLLEKVGIVILLKISNFTLNSLLLI
jgi:hypothetical protein